MDAIAHLAGAFVVFAFLAHVGDDPGRHTAAARAAARSDLPAADGPPVTIIRPVCGLDPYEELTLRSDFELDYARYEILFCCDSPTTPWCRSSAASSPSIRTSTRSCSSATTRISRNPKLNNLIKGWRAAAHAWVVMADSNVLMPRDYLQRLLAGWRADTGLLCAPPIGCLPDGFWAEVECAFLNTYQARWQYAADTRRPRLRAGQDACCGVAPIWSAPAASARSAPRSPRTRRRPRWCAAPASACASSIAPSASRWACARAAQIWSRQVRWAKLRRATFPVFFPPEVLSGAARRCLRPLSRRRPGRVGCRRRRRARRRVVRLRRRCSPRRRLAPEWRFAAAVAAARSDAAGAVGAGVARQLVQLARHRDDERAQRGGAARRGRWGREAGGSGRQPRTVEAQIDRNSANGSSSVRFSSARYCAYAP